MNRWFGKNTALTSIVFFWLSIGAFAQTRVLFLGNSYTYYNDMPAMVKRLAEVSGIACEVVMSVQGGVSLKDHWEEKRGLQSKDLMTNGNFDVVVLQDQSLTPIRYPQRTLTFGKKLATLVQSKNGQAIIFQTWSRKNNRASQRQLNSTFEEFAKLTGAKMAHVADAWHLAMKEYPNLELYDWDGSHPSVIGSYLAALIIYQSIFESLPKNNYEHQAIDNSAIKKCQQIANQMTKKP